MTIDPHPPMPEHERRAEARENCQHEPQQDTIEADDTDFSCGETCYVADCALCCYMIKTPYTDEDPVQAEWVLVE